MELNFRAATVGPLYSVETEPALPAFASAGVAHWHSLVSLVSGRVCN